MAQKQKKQVPFDQIIAALLDESHPFPARYIYRFSDLADADLQLVQKTWPQVPQRRRQAVMEDVEEFNSDFVLNFYDFALVAAHDPEASIRLLSIRTLTEYDNEDLLELFIAAAEKDQDLAVRSAATAALGHYIYLGELEELSAGALEQVEASLLRIHNSQDERTVRRYALEALGYSSRAEVPGLIESAFQSDDEDWLASSLVAMGRSYNKDYRDNILAAMEDDRTAVRVEAVAAAGELELAEASTALLNMLDEGERRVRHAAIWALSQIGGDEVRDALEQMLDESEDEEEADLLDAALENLEFTEGLANFSMLDFNEDDVDDFDLFDEQDFEED